MMTGGMKKVKEATVRKEKRTKIFQWEIVIIAIQEL